MFMLLTFHALGDSYIDRNERVEAEEEVCTGRDRTVGLSTEALSMHTHSAPFAQVGRSYTTLFLLCSFSSTLCGRTLPLVRFSF